MSVETISPASSSAQYPWLPHYPEGLNWGCDIDMGPVPAMLDKTVAAHGAWPGIDFMGKVWSWADIGAQVDALAKAFQDMGVVKGTRIGMFLPNCPTFIVGYYAALKAGATVVNFNPLYTPRELKHQIEDSGTTIMLTLDLQMLHQKMDEMLKTSSLQKLVVARFTDILPFPKSLLFPIFKAKDKAKIAPSDKVVWLHEITAGGGKPTPVAIDPMNDVAVLQYTGGTTGTPKGAALTHANVTANAHQCSLWLGGHGGEGQQKMMGVLPFFHVFAMTAVMNFSVRSAFEIVIPAPRFELDVTLKAIDKKKPHYFPAVPAIYNGINNHPKLAEFDLKSLRYCISGGAPLPVEVKKSFERNTGCVVVEGYGLTESAPVVCVNPIVGANKAGSIGMPVPGTIVEIVSTEDGVSLVKQGERGELCVRGPQVMKGYWNKPEETDLVLKGGRLHTGDVATMDQEGYVYIVDRIKDLIITNGYNVYPRNVEEAIYLHTGVEECIVAGVPDDERGEAVKAWIKPKAGVTLTEKDMLAFLADKISKIEMPRHMEIRETPLPKTMIGKLSRKDILAEEKAKREAA